jgi:hypothetical protein
MTKLNLLSSALRTIGQRESRGGLSGQIDRAVPSFKIGHWFGHFEEGNPASKGAILKSGEYVRTNRMGQHARATFSFGLLGGKMRVRRSHGNQQIGRSQFLEFIKDTSVIAIGQQRWIRFRAHADVSPSIHGNREGWQRWCSL